MIRRQTKVLGVVLFIADSVMILACFAAAFYLKRVLVLPDPHLDLSGHRDLLVIEAPVIMAIFLINGMYSSRGMLADFGSWAKRVFRGVAVAFGAFLFVSFYAKLFEYSRAVFTLFFLLLTAGLLLNRALLSAAGHVLKLSPAWVRRVLVMSPVDSEHSSRLLSRLMSSPLCAVEAVRLPEVRPGVPVHEEALKRIEQGSIDCVLVDLPPEEMAAVSAVVVKAESEGVAVYVTRRLLPAGTMSLSWESIAGTPLIALHPLEIPLAGRFIKRAMDVLLSVLALAVLSPLLAVIAAAVKLTSPGPIFFRQRRVGLDGREFTLLKFRSMHVDAERDTGPVWAREDDPRSTPLGAFLRRTFLDELPQFLNVLAGSMSLVGPRPERPEFVGRFKEEIGRYAHKHWVRPGITGWAQIHGWRGNTDLAERIRHDIWYIENWSLWLDVRILAVSALRAVSGTW